jgi:hypothetical protein
MTAEEWLEQWVEENLNSPVYVDSKSIMRDQAAACMEEAKAAAHSIADIKAAAGGDLETYLVRQQNTGADSELDRLISKDKD